MVRTTFPGAESSAHWALSIGSNGRRTLTPMKMRCADCGCLVESGTRTEVCEHQACYCAGLPVIEDRAPDVTHR
jgi:hypothetical protein